MGRGRVRKPFLLPPSKPTLSTHRTDLHSVWDNSLIAKAIRNVPQKYHKAIAAPALESALRGAIYDPFIRIIVWEGIGVGHGTGRWESEADSWLACPASSSSSNPQRVFTAPRRPPPRGPSGPPATSDTATLCPYAWAAPIHQLNCDVVWPPNVELTGRYENDGAHHPHHCGTTSPEDEAWVVAGDLPEIDTPEFTRRIESEFVIEKLLAQAGVRLAGILNVLFAPQQ